MTPDPGQDVEQEVSYGGAVVRTPADGSEPELIVIRPARTTRLALPKGGGNAGETGESAAAREVREEAGVNVEVRELLGDVNYWYRRGGRLISKTVHFYLCDYISGDTKDHDHEVDEARWMPLSQAIKKLSFAGERDIAKQALSKVAPGL